jgi:hypothetical protein
MGGRDGGCRTNNTESNTMTQINANARMDICLYFDRSLLAANHMYDLHNALHDAAPRWSSGLRTYLSDRPSIPITINDPNALCNAVESSALHRGPRYMELVRRYGAGPYERRSGVEELRGANSSLIVVLSVDEWVMSPSREDWHFGNSLTVQIRSARVEGEDAAEWATKTFELLCARLSPAWGSTRLVDEFRSKNFVAEGRDRKVVGTNVSQHLPGIYWLNFFGDIYCNLIGRDRLLSCPAEQTKVVAGGVLVKISARPRSWDSEMYRRREADIAGYLGRQYFFDRSGATESYMAPAFTYPDLEGKQKQWRGKTGGVQLCRAPETPPARTAGPGGTWQSNP